MYEKKTPRCATCQYKWESRYAKRNGNNDTCRYSRAECHCKHEKAVEAFQRVCPKSHRMPGFIGFTSTKTGVLEMKTGPKWCPLREFERISKEEAMRSNEP